jgi:hypothetical protein
MEHKCNTRIAKGSQLATCMREGLVATQAATVEMRVLVCIPCSLLQDPEIQMSSKWQKDQGGTIFALLQYRKDFNLLPKRMW